MVDKKKEKKELDNSFTSENFMQNAEVKITEEKTEDGIITTKKVILKPEFSPLQVKSCDCNEIPICDGACDRMVSSCFTFTVPEGFTFEYSPPQFPIGITFNLDNIKCIIEPCELPAPPIENPCEGYPPIEGCTVKVCRVRLVGCIPYIAVLRDIVSPNSPFNDGALCTSGNILVDNIICYSCNAVCPEYFISWALIGLYLTPTVDSCGRKVYKGITQLVFTSNCEE